MSEVPDPFLEIRKHQIKQRLDVIKAYDPTEIAILAALISPRLVNQPSKAYQNAMRFLEGIRSEWLQHQIDLLNALKPVEQLKELRRKKAEMAKLRNFPGASKITPPKSFPTRSDVALKHILAEKKTIEKRREVVRSAWEHHQNSPNPSAQSVCRKLELMAKGEYTEELTEEGFWVVARLIKGFQDGRKRRKTKN